MADQEQEYLGYRDMLAACAAGRPRAPKLRMVVVYADPSDYPGKHVARVWTVENASMCLTSVEPLAVCDDLEVCRAAVFAEVGQWAFKIERSADDDPCIVETWL